MAHIFTNNAFTFLTGDIEPTAQDLSIRSADAVLFPQPDQAKGEIFMVTLEHRATNKMEIVECFRRVGPVLSVRRAREGTTPEAFAAGTTVSNRLTAGVIAGGLLGWAEFNRRYLGAYATQPTLDPLGFPLQRGAIMYDLNTDALFVFTVDGWVKWSPSGDLQTGIPPGGSPGDALTRNSRGLIEWQPIVDRNARDSASLARIDATAALTGVASNTVLIGTKVDRGGDTMSGPLTLAPPTNAAGDATPLLQLNSRGVAGAYIRHTKAGVAFSDFVMGADGVPYFTRYNAAGQPTSTRPMLMLGDALALTGGTVSGGVTFEGNLQMPGGARIRNLSLSAQNALIEGGEMIFEGAPGFYGAVNDLTSNVMRWFRTGDFAQLMNLNLVSGEFSVGSSVRATNLVASGQTRAGLVVSNYFRFAEAAEDTGMDTSGDGYGTLISNGQPVLQFQPGGNVYVWGNITGFSDRRMKEDVGIIEDPLNIIENMIGVSFNKIGDATKRRYIGFIAQDVEPLLPSLVERSHDGMMGINYGAYVSVLNEGIKALHYKVRQLEAILHA